jgi:hypothetical protein
MSETRIKVKGVDKFDEREWLRREVLWASLMTPYPAQMAGWFNGTQISQHAGNFSRATLYAERELDLESQSWAFFNQGKNIGGILSSAALFRAYPTEGEIQQLFDTDPAVSSRELQVQARVIDIALGNLAIRSVETTGEDNKIYAECERLAIHAYASQSLFARRHRLLRAGKIMSGLATPEVSKWRETASQNEDGSLPILTIPNGGTPRSAGPRVDKLQPIFAEIIASGPYRSLAAPN